MTPHIDQLDETFSAHESLTPDADTVLARSHAIARSLKRRQWAVRATGTAVVTAGVVAGAIAIPGALHTNSSNTAVIKTASSGDPTAVSSPTAAPQSSAVDATQDFAAYFNAGYDYNDAQQLAQLWNQVGPKYIGKVKAEAGAKLLAGQTLPIPPSGTPATPQDLAEQAFFNAGYDSQDAETLAQMWHETNISQVKVEAGQKLEAGQPLPIQPSSPVNTTITTPESPVDAKNAALAQAFFDAGYTYSDAAQLAQTWNLKETYQAKVEGGQKIENGQTLPIPPSGTPASADQRAMDAYFAAGYDYTDAQRLGQIWNVSDLGQVKVDAGQKLENGETLPIAP
jgi:biotin carboxyl carrier protein